MPSQIIEESLMNTNNTSTHIALLILIQFLYACKPTTIKTQLNTINPETIINNYYKSVGGYESIKSIKTLIKKGHYIEPKYNLLLNADLTKKRPNFRVVGDLDTVGFKSAG